MSNNEYIEFQGRGGLCGRKRKLKKSERMQIVLYPEQKAAIEMGSQKLRMSNCDYIGRLATSPEAKKFIERISGIDSP